MIIMKKIPVLFVLMLGLFLSASASDGMVKKNDASPVKKLRLQQNTSTALSAVQEQKKAPVIAETKKAIVDCNGSAIFYCGGEILTVYVSIIGETQQGDCINFARAVSEFIQENFCGTVTLV